MALQRWWQTCGSANLLLLLPPLLTCFVVMWALLKSISHKSIMYYVLCMFVCSYACVCVLVGEFCDALPQMRACACIRVCAFVCTYVYARRQFNLIAGNDTNGGPHAVQRYADSRHTNAPTHTHTCISAYAN